LTSVRRCAFQLLAVLIAPAAGQQPQTDPPIDEAVRTSIIERLVSKIEAGYVIPDAAQVAIRNLRTAQASGDYKEVGTARRFAERLTSDLRSATHDKHVSVYFDPEPIAPTKSSATPVKAHERFNFGFYKIERLRGNVGYLDVRSFANLNEGRETASAYLDALANFDAIILDLRQNGGGNTPMAAYIASYFLGPKPVHFTDMYWRDQNKTVEVWTSESVPGRRSLIQDLYLLVGPSTFSAAEDFCYSLQQLKRATLVGEKTGGGAHMGRGLQRLSPLFTAFIPVGQSLNPVTKTNWENVGVEPEIKVPEERALIEAHLVALRKLVEREGDPRWQSDLRRAMAEVAAGK
jgi:retinol-binding protein 3